MAFSIALAATKVPFVVATSSAHLPADFRCSIARQRLASSPRSHRNRTDACNRKIMSYIGCPFPRRRLSLGNLSLTAALLVT